MHLFSSMFYILCLIISLLILFHLLQSIFYQRYLFCYFFLSVSMFAVFQVTVSVSHDFHFNLCIKLAFFRLATLHSNLNTFIFKKYIERKKLHNKMTPKKLKISTCHMQLFKSFFIVELLFKLLFHNYFVFFL